MRDENRLTIVLRFQGFGKLGKYDVKLPLLGVKIKSNNVI